jgi:hypothetical protein
VRRSDALQERYAPKVPTTRGYPWSDEVDAFWDWALLELLVQSGANLRHLALQIEYGGCDTGSGAFPRFFEAVPEKRVARRWNRARSETLEGRVGFGCPCTEVGKENAQVHQREAEEGRLAEIAYRCLSEIRATHI